jgi:hypothetical protein
MRTLYVRMVSKAKEPFTIEISETATIQQLKQLLATEKQIDLGGIRLVHKQKILADDTPVSTVETSGAFPLTLYAKAGSVSARPPPTPAAAAPKPSPTPASPPVGTPPPKRASPPVQQFAAVNPPAAPAVQEPAALAQQPTPGPRPSAAPFGEEAAFGQSPTFGRRAPFGQAGFGQLSPFEQAPPAGAPPEAHGSGDRAEGGEPVSDEAVAQLVDMGFDAGQSRKALELCEGNVEIAANLLVSGSVSEEGLRELGIDAGTEGSPPVPFSQLDPRLRHRILQIMQSEPCFASLVAEVQSGREVVLPIRDGVSTVLTRQDLEAAGGSGHPPGPGGMGLGPGAFAPVRAGAGAYGPGGRGGIGPRPGGGFGPSPDGMGPGGGGGYARSGGFAPAGEMMGLGGFGRGPGGIPGGGAAGMGEGGVGPAPGGGGIAETAPGGPGPQIDPVLRSIVQQLTDDELDTVRELIREGFTAGDVVQIFLISGKDVDKTRATLLSMK